MQSLTLMNISFLLTTVHLAGRDIVCLSNEKQEGFSHCKEFTLLRYVEHKLMFDANQKYDDKQIRITKHYNSLSMLF